MIGIDVASVSRMRGLLGRFPRAEQRFFTVAEIDHCRRHNQPARHFAGTFAAKEAVVKAARLGHVAAWARRIEITRDTTGAPAARIEGVSTPVALSISHDADTAIAVAVALPQV